MGGAPSRWLLQDGAACRVAAALRCERARKGCAPHSPSPACAALWSDVPPPASTHSLRTNPAGARLAVLVGAEACEVPPHALQPVHTHADVLLLPRTREADPATLEDPAEVAAAGTALLLPALGAEEAALSSGRLRRLISERSLDEANLRTLSAHGYHGARVDAALRAAFKCTSELWLEQVSEGAKDRGEWVEPLVAVCDT